MDVDSSFLPTPVSHDYDGYQSDGPSACRSLSFGSTFPLSLPRFSGQSDPLSFSPLPSIRFEDFSSSLLNDEVPSSQFCFHPSCDDLSPSQRKSSLLFPVEMPSLYSPNEDFLSSFPSSNESTDSPSSLLPRGVIHDQSSPLKPETIEDLDKKYPLSLLQTDSSQQFSEENPVCPSGSTDSVSSTDSLLSLDSTCSLDSIDDAEEHHTKKRAPRSRKRWKCSNCHYLNSISTPILNSSPKEAKKCLNCGSASPLMSADTSPTIHRNSISPKAPVDTPLFQEPSTATPLNEDTEVGLGYKLHDFPYATIPTNPFQDGSEAVAKLAGAVWLNVILVYVEQPQNRTSRMRALRNHKHYEVETFPHALAILAV